jgi:Flp pilus assembly protein TadD
MARAAVKAKQQERAKSQAARPQRRTRGRRGHAGGGNPNQQLFFSRLRRRAKPMYVILAVLFAATFALLGVGSGSNGGLDQLFNGLGIFGGSGTSISAAQKEIAKNPAKGYRDLATAYEQKGNTAAAVSALQSYTGLRKKDVNAWAELGGLQLTQAQAFATSYQNAATAQQAAAPSTSFLPSGSLGTALGTNPIEQAAASQSSSATSSLYQSAILSYQSALTSYKHVATLRPDDPNAQLQEATTAQNAGSNSVAVAAYKRYLKLVPTSPNKAQIEKLITQLSPAPAPKTKTKPKSGSK